MVKAIEFVNMSYLAQKVKPGPGNVGFLWVLIEKQSL